MNSRLDTIQASILLAKFRAFRNYELDHINRAAALYSEFLKDIPSHTSCAERRFLFQLGAIYCTIVLKSQPGCHTSRIEKAGDSYDGLLSASYAPAGRVQRDRQRRYRIFRNRHTV